MGGSGSQGANAPRFPSHAFGAGTLAGARAAGAAPAREPAVQAHGRDGRQGKGGGQDGGAMARILGIRPCGIAIKRPDFENGKASNGRPKFSKCGASQKRSVVRRWQGGAKPRPAHLGANARPRVSMISHI